MLLRIRSTVFVAWAGLLAFGCKHAPPEASSARSARGSEVEAGPESGLIGLDEMFANVAASLAKPDYDANMAASLATVERQQAPDQLALQAAPELRVVDGDVLVEAGGERDGSAADGQRGFELSTSVLKGFWPDAIVPYAIDPALDEVSKGEIQAAVTDYRLKTNIRLVPYDPAVHRYNLFFTSDLTERQAPKGAAAAELGFRGRRQLVWQSAGSFAEAVYLHEIGHALGLYHEQQRRDRDQFIRVNWENIQESAAHAYAITGGAGRDRQGQDIGAYDFDSVMHYGDDSFCKREDGTELSRCIGPTFVRVDGERHHRGDVLSAGDIAALAQLYPKAPLDVLPLRADDGSPASMTHAEAAAKCAAQSYALPDVAWLGMALENVGAVGAVFDGRSCVWAANALNAQGTGFFAVLPVRGGPSRRMVKADDARCMVLCSLSAEGPVRLDPVRTSSLDSGFGQLLQEPGAQRSMRMTTFMRSEISSTIIMKGTSRKIPADVHLNAATIVANNFDTNECSRQRKASDVQKLLVLEVDEKGAPIGAAPQNMLAGPTTLEAGHSYSVEATMVNPAGCLRVDYDARFSVAD
jgi:hypothetical protein